MERYNIKFNDNTKKYLQIYNHIKDMILKKELKAHEKLQPIRKLSEFIGVNNTTVVKAYELLENEGYKNVFIGTIEGYPGFNEVINRVKRNNIEEVTLMPLLVVAGEHVKNDISSDDEDSWKSMFEREGIKVNIIMKGLGEYDEFNKLYINRINDLIENRYKGIGETKKGNENNNDII
mgnify:CR=1 FL=1